ncbi:hypothetical protein ACIGZJ_19520 [Kitasatospora sp. NPDC052868]|uniref:hypothetical protein n=1 Tax=Kitasatospora sp. NPDC052868 TaxID=3364060 RepID=UPI0037C66B1C
MPEATPLVEAVDSLADRFRSMPQSRLLGAVPGHASRAAAALVLARWLAGAAQAVEGLPVRDFPDAGAFAVGDQLAVAGHDLAAALAALPEGARVLLPGPADDPADDPAAANGAAGSATPVDGTGVDGAAVLAGALAEVAATAALCA